MTRRIGVRDSTTVNTLSLLRLAHGQHQPILGDGQIERIWALVAAIQTEEIALQDVKNGDLAFVLDARARALDGSAVERNGREPSLGVGVAKRRLKH